VYIELHCASAFSFLRGASLPETLVERAAALGYTALALLDADGVYGAPRFHKAARQAGLKPIIGAELTITGHRDSRLRLPATAPRPMTACPPGTVRNADRPASTGFVGSRSDPTLAEAGASVAP
jgi:error-prone DNA polymerase